MQAEEFRRHGHDLIDWVADYLQGVEAYPVLPDLQPGDVRRRLPAEPPREPEAMETILKDFRTLILPAVTHWNHPRFFAYFPANQSGPSILGELLSAALGVNAMVWQSCPAATELEEVVMDWLRRMIGLPESFRGVIQDTASTATIVALLCARERATDFATNEHGFYARTAAALRVYCSREAHSSVEKGLKAAGFGREHLVPIAVDNELALDPTDLAQKIAADREQGLTPCAVVATVGTTSSTALDPLVPIADLADRHRLWLHVDAALAGSAAILPEKRAMFDGLERADSFVFNPHKWLFTNFDCSAFFCRDPQTLVRTFAIDPEYLRTAFDSGATNLRDWGLALGRRFRALKLWFVLRSYGVEGLQARLREHLGLAQEFMQWVVADPQFELLAPVPLQTICFRHCPPEVAAAGAEALDRHNAALLQRVNATGQLFMTHTRLRERYCLRLSIGQTETRREHVVAAWRLIRDCAQAR